MPAQLVDCLKAAELLGVSARTIDNLRRHGELPSVKIGTRRLFAVADIVRFIDARRDAADSTRQRQAHILACIERAGAHGVTDDEGQDWLWERPQLFAQQRRELTARGLVVDSGRTRPASDGSMATVWVAAKHAATVEGGGA